MVDFKAAIFDFDGTLVNSMGMWQNIAVEWAKKNGVAVTPELTNSFKYATLEQTLAYLRDNYKEININKALRSWCMAGLIKYITTVQPIDGAREYLHKLKKNGIKTAIATNCPRPLCKAALVRRGMSKYIDRIISSTSVGKGKDEPDIYLKAAQMLETPPADCMVYEDSHIALSGVKKANMRFTAVYAPDSPCTEKMQRESDIFIKSYRELL